MTKADLQVQRINAPISALLNQLVNLGFTVTDSQDQDTVQLLKTYTLDNNTSFILVLDPKPSTTAKERCPTVINTQSKLSELLQKGKFEFAQCQLFLPHSTLTMIATNECTLLKHVSLPEQNKTSVLLYHTPYLLTDSGRFDSETITELQALSQNGQLKFITVETTKDTAELIWERQ